FRGSTDRTARGRARLRAFGRRNGSVLDPRTVASGTAASTRVRGRAVTWADRHARLLLLAPALVAVAAVAVYPLGYALWASLVDFLPGKLVGHHVGIDWTAQTAWTYAGIVVADAWQWTPIVFLILLAGLRLIPPSLYEAASIDGATAWQSFRWITAPLLAPVV